jgi:murein L,D-transpeptidase YafK
VAQKLPCPASVAEFGLDDDPRLQGSRLVVVVKEQRRLMVFDGGKLKEGTCFPIGLGSDHTGSHPTGTKTREGDRKTPEGWYRTTDKPWSNFYKAIYINYPNSSDASLAAQEGRITKAQQQEIDRALKKGLTPPQTTPLGGEILIHGGGSSSDWTWGCVALDDDDTDALRAVLPQGMKTDVLILP